MKKNNKKASEFLLKELYLIAKNMYILFLLCRSGSDFTGGEVLDKFTSRTGQITFKRIGSGETDIGADVAHGNRQEARTRHRLG